MSLDIRRLSSIISVAAQLEVTDLEQAARLGFRTVIDNRPDNEGEDQPQAQALRAAAEESGLRFHYQPVISGGITAADVDAFDKLVTAAEQPVLAFCRTGTRCTMLWALSQAGRQGAEEIIATAARAGYDLSALRPNLGT